MLVNGFTRDGLWGWKTLPSVSGNSEWENLPDCTWWKCYYHCSPRYSMKVPKISWVVLGLSTANSFNFYVLCNIFLINRQTSWEYIIYLGRLPTSIILALKLRMHSNSIWNLSGRCLCVVGALGKSIGFQLSFVLQLLGLHITSFMVEHVHFEWLKCVTCIWSRINNFLIAFKVELLFCVESFEVYVCLRCSELSIKLSNRARATQKMRSSSKGDIY